MKIFSALSLLLGMLTVVVSGGSAEAAKYRVLHTFRSATDDGYYPEGPLYRDTAGNIYGTTLEGGVNEQHMRCRSYFKYCRGTVFKITKDGVETLLHSFRGPPDGRAPRGGLVADRAGNLYGTTEDGGGFSPGVGNDGTLFKITPEGNFTVLRPFDGSATGTSPGSLLFGNNGTLYGVANGFNSAGVALEFSTSGQVLFTHTFGTGTDGAHPAGGLVQDHAGNVYGTTSGGGPSCENGYRDGTIFRIDTHNVETSFPLGCSTNFFASGGLAIDGSHNLYGLSGGPACPWNPHEFCGSVFKVSADGTYTVLHDFTGGGGNTSDGWEPSGPLAIGKDGNLYGFTTRGGAYDMGTIYKMSKDGTITILYSFAHPVGPSNLMMDNKGRIYGTSDFGGAYHKGFVFMFDPYAP